MRIRNLCTGNDTTYTYDTNCRLSRLLTKTTNGTVTKYVYGRGLIGEETSGAFKTYHFDCRGSTVAITNANGNITDTFAYDTYGKLLSRTGTSTVIFGYNGRDGVVIDANGLIYMRARYYSPDMRRFVNADVVAGMISNAITLNRFAYANGNPVSFVDPFGLAADDKEAFIESLKYENWIIAVLVTNFSLPYVGHSEIYFLSKDNVWVKTEFNLADEISNVGIKPAKGSAGVFIDNPLDKLDDKKEVFSSFYDVTTGQFIKSPDNINYVVLSGDFNASVDLAVNYYKNEDFGRYNFLFSNCADYTNELLDVADINGMFSQIASDGNKIVTIPVIRELELSIASGLDSLNSTIIGGLINSGEAARNYGALGNIVGDTLIGAGNAFDAMGNIAGDIVDMYTGFAGDILDGAKKIASVTANGIIDIGTALWNSIF